MLRECLMMIGSVGARRIAGALAVAGGVLLVVRVGLVIARGDGGLITLVTTVGIVLCAGACGLAGWTLAERNSRSVRAGAAAVGVMLAGVGVLVLVALIGQLVGGGPAVLSELGTLAVAAVAIGGGATAVGQRLED